MKLISINNDLAINASKIDSVEVVPITYYNVFGWAVIDGYYCVISCVKGKEYNIRFDEKKQASELKEYVIKEMLDVFK